MTYDVWFSYKHLDAKRYQRGDGERFNELLRMQRQAIRQAGYSISPDGTSIDIIQGKDSFNAFMAYEISPRTDLTFTPRLKRLSALLEAFSDREGLPPSFGIISGDRRKTLIVGGSHE